MNDDFKNIKSWGNSLDNIFGNIMGGISSAAFLWVLAALAIPFAWGFLWILVELNIL